VLDINIKIRLGKYLFEDGLKRFLRSFPFIQRVGCKTLNTIM